MKPSPFDRRTLIRATLALSAALAWSQVVDAATDWISPRPVEVFTPSATLVPGQARSLSFFIRTNRLPANLSWSAAAAGQFIAAVTPSSGTLSLAADQTATIPLTVTIPSSVASNLTGSIFITVSGNPGPGQVAPEARLFLRASVDGRPEIYPTSAALQTGAGTAGNVTFAVHSLTGSSEQFHINSPITRLNPDSNNSSMVMLGGAPPSPVTLPAGGTVMVSVPTTVPGNAYPGNLNSVKIQLTSETDPNKGLSDGTGFVLVNAPHPDSLPTAFWPAGLVPQLAPHSGRDGPIPIPDQGLYAMPSGTIGVRVLRDSALSQVGIIDLDNNNVDDRLVGTVRFPGYVASMAIIPAFVNSASDVLDLGLVACGQSGLALVDLRTIVDPPAGTWEDFWDLDFNGVDDRIFRQLPIPGFSTDVEWFQTPEGRYIALVAAADNGSNPVAAGYNPLITVPGTGAGVVAIDVNAALDSLPGVPFMAGTLPTPGSTLDLALRGGPLPDLAVADGADSVTFWTVHASGSPATVGYERRGGVMLSSAWGTPFVRDLDWLGPNPASDSTWVVASAMAAGLQLIKAPPGGTPLLAIVQKTDASAIGVSATQWGNVAVAMGTAGASLFKLPRNDVLAQLGPAASPPYQTPVILNTNTPWPASTPLKVATHGTTASSITTLRFAPALDPSIIPDLVCGDGSRTLLVRPGSPTTLLGVEGPSLALTPGIRLRVAPNPVRDGADFQVLADHAFAFAPDARVPVNFEVIDIQGRVVRRLPPAPAGGAPSGFLVRARFDGRAQDGSPLGSGRYWVRASQRGGWSARAGFVLVR